MNDLRDIARAIAQGASAMRADSTIEVPLDEGRWVRVLPCQQGWVVCAVQRSIGLTPTEIADRREELARLAPACRWASGIVGSVDARGDEVLSVVVDPQLAGDDIEAILRQLFERLASCGPVTDAELSLPPGVAA